MTNTRISFGTGTLLLGLLTAVTYLPVWRAGFVWDDSSLITENRMIYGNDGLRRFWLTTEAPDYYPLTWSLWWVEWRLWGEHPTGYHLVNVLVHALNVILLWSILKRLNVPGAWAAAAVFAVHPVNVATVAWISEQKNTVSFLFFLLSMFFYLRFDDTGRARWYWLACHAFLLALLTKSAAVMLPVVLLGCLWWRHGALRARDWQNTVPFFILALVSGCVTIWFQSHRALQDVIVRDSDFNVRLAEAGWMPWFYLWKAVWPVDLMVIYPRWEWNSYWPGIALMIAFAVSWRNRNGWGRACLFGIGYFVVMLGPVLGFFDQGFYQYALVADHWLYYSMAGVITLVVAALERLRWALFAVVVVLAFVTWKRTEVYASDETLWRDNVARNPNVWTYHNLAIALKAAGKTPEAIEFYRKTLGSRPVHVPASQEQAFFATVHYNFGVALRDTGDSRGEVAQYEDALRLKPDYAEVRYNLGVALAEAGNVPAAIEQWRQALEIKPTMPDAHNNLGAALARVGREDEAIEHYQEAVRLEPGYAQAHKNLADAMSRRGDWAEAIEHYRQALRVQPGNAQYHNDLGVALWRAGKIQAAIGEFKQALQLKPDNVQARHNLAGALGQIAPEAGKP